MSSTTSLWTQFSKSLPIQLFWRQLRHHKGLLVFWALVLGFVYGWIGKAFGASYLFLEPEYMGQENFWSNLIIGSALGAFLFAYTITLYIHESYRFPFIATTRHPFYLFSFNNFLLPGGFLSLFLLYFFRYHLSVNEGRWGPVLEKGGGLILGIGLVFLISATYFFANQSWIQRYGKKIEKGLNQHNPTKNRRIILEKARRVMKQQRETTYYLAPPFRLASVKTLKSTQFRTIVRILSEHHGKLLLLQILTILLIVGLGLVEDRPLFQVPAGASFLLLFSLIMLAMGAIRFWFRKVGAMALVIVIGIGFAYNYLDLLHDTNQAFGMDYEAAPAPYTEAHLDSLTQETFYEQDREQTLLALENWLARHREVHGAHSKPKAVFVSASGGGLRSAFWTFRVLQRLDSLTAGQFPNDIRLMTGASGGMFGQTYFRELYLRQQLGEISDLQQPHYQEQVAKDLLNRISFSLLSDIFLPNRKVEIGDQSYYHEGGFSFDDQLAQNLPELANRRLGDYAAHESAGRIPQLILTPTILNQGRQLYISSSPVSFLTRPNRITDRYLSRAKGVEFRRFFAQQDADSLLMTTALRMNATFPLVLPVVELPSNPVMEVMDAGAVDNYGASTALKYLFEFREWFAENTDGVVFVQVRDNGRKDPIRMNDKRNALSRITAPLGGGYYSIAQAKDLQGDYLMEFVHEWYDGYVEVIPIEYPRETSSDPASLSFHLTQREKQNILTAMETPLNVAAFQLIEGLYQPELLATKP